MSSESAGGDNSLTRAVAVERERICQEAELWARLSSYHSVASTLAAFADAIRRDVGPFDDEGLCQYLRTRSGRPGTGLTDE